MKIQTDDKPIKLNEKSYVTLEFEVNDMFVDKDENLILLKSNVDGVEFMDMDKKILKLAIDKDFTDKYRFCGTVEDELLNSYEDSTPLK